MSDGVAELRNPRRQEFCMESVLGFVEQNAAYTTSQEMIQQLFEDMQSFMHGNKPHDDCTLLCLKHRSTF
jgi:serine phosphatase RsbU (regulator of sigma subunit)